MHALTKTYKSIGIAAFVALLFCFGEMNGIINIAPLQQRLLSNPAPNSTWLDDRLFFNLSLGCIWLLAFCTINVRYSSGGLHFFNAGFGRCAQLSLFCIVLFVSIWPVGKVSSVPLSYDQWPADLTTFLYQEDGLFETLTAVFLLFTAVRFFQAGRHANRQLPGHQPARLLLVFSFISMILMMEEISWGQRIFSWSTPDIIRDLNYQGETNVHNFLNPVLIDGQRIAALVMSLVLLTAVFYRKRVVSPALRRLLPAKAFFPVSILLALAGMLNAELFEEVFVIFLFFYSNDLKKAFGAATTGQEEPAIQTDPVRADPVLLATRRLTEFQSRQRQWVASYSYNPTNKIKERTETTAVVPHEEP